MSWPSCVSVALAVDFEGNDSSAAVGYFVVCLGILIAVEALPLCLSALTTQTSGAGGCTSAAEEYSRWDIFPNVPFPLKNMVFKSEFWRICHLQSQLK